MVFVDDFVIIYLLTNPDFSWKKYDLFVEIINLYHDKLVLKLPPPISKPCIFDDSPTVLIIHYRFSDRIIEV